MGILDQQSGALKLDSIANQARKIYKHSVCIGDIRVKQVNDVKYLIHMEAWSQKLTTIIMTANKLFYLLNKTYVRKKKVTIETNAKIFNTVYAVPVFPTDVKHGL